MSPLNPKAKTLHADQGPQHVTQMTRNSEKHTYEDGTSEIFLL